MELLGGRSDFDSAGPQCWVYSYHMCVSGAYRKTIFIIGLFHHIFFFLKPTTTTCITYRVLGCIVAPDHPKFFNRLHTRYPIVSMVTSPHDHQRLYIAVYDRNFTLHLKYHITPPHLVLNSLRVGGHSAKENQSMGRIHILL